MTLRAAVALVLLLAAPACAVRQPPAPAPPAAVLDELPAIDELRGAFDRDRAHPRIVLLLSPT